MKTDIRYFWVRFFTGAEWQLVKFYTEDKTRKLKGLDWMAAHELEKFGNITYELGPEIHAPK